MTERLQKIIVLALAIMLYAGAARAIETQADFALVMDADTGVVMFEKQADTAMTPASMSKLMTILVVLEALQVGTISPDEMFFVSDDAWRRGGIRSGGSTMFLKPRSRVKVIDLLRGVIVQSGNDACIVLAQGIGGSERNFAKIMTRRAEELGLTNSRFTNATGLPHSNHKMTARDLAKLTQILIRDHSDYYPLFAERAFTWNRIRQENRNPLLYANIGADGLKTGHTNESGYGLVASAEQNGRRIILVLNGLNTKRIRAAESRKMMNWAFRNFSHEVLLAAGDEALTLPVWHGNHRQIAVTPARQFLLTLPRSGKRKMAVTVTYDRPVLAPIEKGQRLAVMRVTMPGLSPQEMPLVALHDVARGGVLSRAVQSLIYLIAGDDDE